MFIVPKALLISSAPVLLLAGGAIWLNHFATVLFNVCMAVTVALCYVAVVCGCVLYVCCYVRKKAILQCFQLLSGGTCLCEVPLSMSLLGFPPYVASLCNCAYYVVG